MVMQKGLSVKRIIALVNVLAKLHKFCIVEVSNNRESAAIQQQLSVDTLNIMNNKDGYVPMESSNEHVFLCCVR